MNWQRPYDDVAHLYAEVAVDVADIGWQMWMNSLLTCGIILASGLVPRGPVVGWHVAPCYWFLVWLLFKRWSLPDSTP
jgi:hypothetical protein